MSVGLVGLFSLAPLVVFGLYGGAFADAVDRRKLALTASLGLWGLSLLLVGHAASGLDSVWVLYTVVWVGVAMLAVSGAADMVSAAYRSTILQVAAPDNLRGRLQGVFTVVVAGGPRMGDFVAGSSAALTTPTIALAVGGVVCIAGVLVASSRQ